MVILNFYPFSMLKLILILLIAWPIVRLIFLMSRAKKSYRQYEQVDRARNRKRVESTVVDEEDKKGDDGE